MFLLFALFAAVGTLLAVAGVKVSQDHSPFGGQIRSWTPTVAKEDLAQIYALVGAGLLIVPPIIGGGWFYIFLQVFLVLTSSAWWIPRVWPSVLIETVRTIRIVLMVLTIVYAFWLLTHGQIQWFEIPAWIGLEGIAVGYLYEHDDSVKRPLALFIGGFALVVSASLGFYFDPAGRSSHGVWAILNVFFAWESWVWLQSKLATR